MTYKHLYTHFLSANVGKSHFTCHSHHYWPDVTLDAVTQYWQDSANMVDDKWDHIFGKIVPETQSLIASHLGTSNPQQLVFAPNTHELLYRLFSCFEPGKPLKVLTTDSEFYSFSRQSQRLAELPNVEIVQVPTFPLDTFEARIIQTIESDTFDFIFFSHVFFNSGMVIENLNKVVDAVTNDETIIAIDGYHGFMALPTDLSGIEDRVFYLSGSYKYAQAGEGCCFMHVPKRCKLRPIYTGWFAEFGDLSNEKHGMVQYSKDGNRFAGATMDYSALYKLHAVLTKFKLHDISVESIHKHVQGLQKTFISGLESLKHPLLSIENLVARDIDCHGHFFTFELGDPDKAVALSKELRSKHVYTDFRGSRIRFGFAMYQDNEDCNLFSLLGSN